jgi:DNA polymerase I-like protein with 3'-5' exonuclease and polymerase domains
MKASKSSTPLAPVVGAIRTADDVALDLETTGLDPRRSEIRLLQIATEEKTYVIDTWRHAHEELRAVVEALGDARVVAHGATFEWAFIYHHFGVELTNLVDTMLLEQVWSCGDVAGGFGLGEVAARALHIDLDKSQQLSDWSAPILTKQQLEYAALDAQVLLPLLEGVTEAIEDEFLERVAQIELEALPAVARMKYEGMPVDRAAWEAHAAEVEAQMKALERKMLDAEWLPARAPIPQEWKLSGEDCRQMLLEAGLEDVGGTTAKDLKPFVDDYEIVGRLLAYRKAKGDERENLKAVIYELAPEKPPAPAPPWNFASPQQVAEISYLITGETFISTDEATLLTWVDEHPFFSLLLDHRKLAKRARTYGPEWFKDAYDEDRGRVYPGWRQIGTSTGRFACAAPNAQNLPNTGPYRSFFEAPRGRTFVGVDYSQIEVRIIAKILNERRLLDLFERGADVYRSTAAGLLGIAENKVTKEQRQLAKAILLGMLYGLSAYGLPTYAFKGYGIKMTPSEAEEHVDVFYELYPELQAYHDEVLEELNSRGHVDQKTLAGRRRDNITDRNEAINAPVQGSAADGLKLAMAEVHRRLQRFGGTAFIVASIHDELLIECEEADAQEVLGLVEEAMVSTMHELVNATEPHVPIVVEGTVTTVWTKD